MPRPSRPHFQNSNVPNPLKLPKGTLQKIEFPKELEEEIKRIWEGKPPTKLVEKWKQAGLLGNHPEKYYVSPSISSRYNSVKVLVGYNSNIVGYCSKCKNLNTHILKQNVDGAVIITRFCSEHVPT